MLFKFSKKTETSLHKRQSIWSTFKKAYLKSRNFEKFWNNLDKNNLPKDLVEITNLFIKSESYLWTSKYWRHLIINHYTHISNLNKNEDPLTNILSSDYSGLTFLDEFSVEKKLRNKKKLEDFKNYYLKKYESIIKKPIDNLSNDKSLEHNIALLNLYEKLKSKNFDEICKKINNRIYLKYNPCLEIDNVLISQHLLLSFTEYKSIKKLIGSEKKSYNFLELGAGNGRTANMLLSLEDNCKYVIADLPPSIYFSYKNLSDSFKNKKISTAFHLNDKNMIHKELMKNDILFIFPHQLKFFDEKTFDISISIGNLCEMEKPQIKKYMELFEKKSRFLYFTVWEVSGLPYSFFKYYSVHNKKDYEVKESWVEHFKNRRLMPHNQYELGYEFKS